MASSREIRDFLKGMAFLSPWLMGFCAFTLLPICLSLYYSFCNYSLLQEPVFRGWINYENLIHDQTFWKMLGNSLEYSAISLPMGLLMSLGVAVLLNTNVVGRSVFRTIVFIPSLIPTVASAMLWMWLYNAKLGLFNTLLADLGQLINSILAYLGGLIHMQLRVNIVGPQWLNDKHWVVPSLAMMSLWGIGNTVVIYLAGLQDVPRELYEAADLDGAGPWSKLWNVTLPMISPVIFFNLVMAIIGMLQVFDAPFIMTGGGPEQSSYFFTQFIYDNGFVFFKQGYASAVAWIQLMIVVVFTAIAFLTSRRWVHYQGKQG